MKAAIFKDPILVKRYGNAFFAVLRRTRSFESAVQECRDMKDLFRADHRFMQFLLSPEIIHSDKEAFIESVLGDHFCSLTKNFLKYLLNKERIERAENIFDFINLTYAHEGVMSVLLKTAYPLDLDMISDLEQLLSKKFNQRMKFYIELDGSLLGGVQVTIGNKVIDGSIRKGLNELHEKLLSAGVYENGTEA